MAPCCTSADVLPSPTQPVRPHTRESNRQLRLRCRSFLQLLYQFPDLPRLVAVRAFEPMAFLMRATLVATLPTHREERDMPRQFLVDALPAIATVDVEVDWSHKIDNAGHCTPPIRGIPALSQQEKQIGSTRFSSWLNQRIPSRIINPSTYLVVGPWQREHRQ